MADSRCREFHLTSNGRVFVCRTFVLTLRSSLELSPVVADCQSPCSQCTYKPPSSLRSLLTKFPFLSFIRTIDPFPCYSGIGMDESVERSQLASEMFGRKAIKIFRYHFYGSYKVNYHFHNVLWSEFFRSCLGRVLATPSKVGAVCNSHIGFECFGRSSQNASISLGMKSHRKFFVNLA